MLYAIAVYRYNSEGKLEKTAYATQFSGGLFATDFLQQVQTKTLPKALEQGMHPDKIYYFPVGSEHHYLVHTQDDHIRVIVSRNTLDPKECSYLFHNSRYIPLDEIIKNPFGYTGRDASMDKLAQNVEKLKFQLLEIQSALAKRDGELASLLDRSEKLTLESDSFVRNSRQLNSCCAYS